MSHDPRSMMDEAIARAKLHTGEEPSTEDMVRNFARMNPAERVNYLSDLDREQVTGEELSLDDAVRQQEFINAIHNMHARLRKVGR